VGAVALLSNTIAVLYLGGEIRLGGADHLDAKYAAALAVIHAYAGKPLNFVDVSVPSDPVSSP
jgi:hypothetical protein